MCEKHSQLDRWEGGGGGWVGGDFLGQILFYVVGAHAWPPLHTSKSKSYWKISKISINQMDVKKHKHLFEVV